MKKNNLLIAACFAATLVISIVSCSSDADVKDDYMTQQSISSTGNDELVQNLREFNSRFSGTHSMTRGARWKSFWRALTDFFVADGKGFISGITKGWKDGSEKAGIVGGAVAALDRGVCTSVGASLEVVDSRVNGSDTKAVPIASQEIQSSVLQRNIETEYAYLEAHLDTMCKAVEEEKLDEIAIEIPSECETVAKYVATMHNAILCRLDQCIDSTGTMQPIEYEEISVTELSMSSQDFDAIMEAYANGEWESLDEQLIETQVNRLFSEAVTESVCDIYDLVELVNGYMQIIEADDSLTEEQKEILYISLTISAYSFQHWDAVFDFESLFEEAE